jgi:hypothetical protein
MVNMLRGVIPVDIVDEGVETEVEEVGENIGENVGVYVGVYVTGDTFLGSITFLGSLILMLFTSK